VIAAWARRTYCRPRLAVVSLAARRNFSTLGEKRRPYVSTSLSVQAASPVRFAVSIVRCPLACSSSGGCYRDSRRYCPTEWADIRAGRRRQANISAGRLVEGNRSTFGTAGIPRSASVHTRIPPPAAQRPSTVTAMPAKTASMQAASQLCRSRR